VLFLFFVERFVRKRWQEKVTQRVCWVENPTNPQAVCNVGFGNPT
jgi:hypothetical protein